MKTKFFTKSMITDIKGGLKSSLDYLWITAALGIITGFGVYTTLFGVLILTFVFLVFYKNLPLVFSVTIPVGASIAFFNVAMGGRSSTLFAMLFVSSLMLALSAFIKKDWIKFLKVPKPVSRGFLAGTAAICIILSLPLFLGQKTFCSLGLMFNSIYSVFQNTDEFALTLSLLVFALSYYLKGVKFGRFSTVFFAVVIASVVNAVYGAPLDSAASGLQNLKPVVVADFGHVFLILFFGFLLACIVFAQTKVVSELFNIKSNKKMVFLTGVTGIFGSISGFITGLAAPLPTKKAVIHCGKTKIVTLTEFLILLIVTIYFAKIAPFIPACALGAALVIEAFKVLKKSFAMQKSKYLLVKIVFWITFLLTVVNLAIGVLFAAIVTFFTNFLRYKKYN